MRDKRVTQSLKLGRLAFATTLCGAATLLSTVAVAQSLPLAQEQSQNTTQPPGATDGPVLDEIVVTAQRRQQRLIDVPIAVTVVTGSDLAARGVTSLQDMQYAVPGLTIAETGPGQERIQLDGIGSKGGSTGAPTVGEYLDEMPITAPDGGQGLDLRLIDMQRVEVLHGPQATLYGEGSMGGTVHYITQAPDLARFDGEVAGNWGSIADGADSYRGDAVLNAPLVPNVLGVRLVAGYERDGGWIDSLATGRKDINGADFRTFRGTILYRPLNNLSVSLMVLHQQQTQDYQNFGMPDRRTATAFPTFNEETYNLGNLVITYDLGWATLTNSTGFLHREPDVATDFTAYFLPFLPLLGLPPSVTSTIGSIGYPNVSKHNALSEELRLGSNSAGRFNYLVGAYFRDYRADGVDDTVTAPGTLPFPLLDEIFASSSKSWAAYVQLRYELTQNLEAQLGVRHYQDHEVFTQTGLGVFDVPGTNTGDGTFTSNNPQLNLSYKLGPGGLVYLNAAKGFRSGQFNLGAPPPAPPSVGPETLWTYQLGEKQEWLGRRLDTDFSVYYNQWKDIQALGVADGSPLSYFTNSGRASGPGVNFNVLARPIPQFTLSATVGFADMKYDVNSAETNAGDPLDMVSRWTYSVAADERHPLSAGSTLTVHVDFGHASGYELIIRDYPGPQQVFPTDRRNVLNARLGLDFGTYEVALFGHNLTNDNGTLYPAIGSFPEPVLPTPRTLGVEVKVDF
ncbi:MAG TPA: TonB-dependent receptor [Steroidobacteraceae bacterium]|jgi:outer membrane receptor protein involved in Fe transport|nr:TonB-dependent receptor [Steroidobacteraceae bacterium]